MSAPGNLWRRVHGSVTGRPTNFSWIVPGKLAGSGRPMTRAELEWAVGQGVAAVVTMTERPLPAEWVGGLGYLHVPTPDMAAPEQDGIGEAVRFIEKRIGAGEPVMVHCAAGMGRAGTILACYLARRGGMGAAEAVARVRSERPGSIQSEEQEEAVAEYARRAA